MKKISMALFGVLPMLIVLWGCTFILGPDEPVNGAEGNLIVSIGTTGGVSRAISSGADLPGDVFAGLRYELILSGPGGETLDRTVSGGENLNLTAALGERRIDARAYQQDVEAGTGSLAFTVTAGDNSVRVPMSINGTCYEIGIDSDIKNGVVASNFSAAFPGTTVTLSVTPDLDYTLKRGTLNYNNGVTDVSIVTDSYTFVMPAADIRIGAQFVLIDGNVDAGFDWQ
jgi:hypothetical protein